MIGILSLIAATLAAGAGDTGKKVDYDTGYRAYFVKNNAPIEKFPAYLVLTDKKHFDQVFGVGFTMKKPKTLEPKAFDAKIAVVVVKRGNAPVTYKLQNLTAAKDELRIEYDATDGQAGTATFATPLIVLADGRDYRSVVFVENGKEVARVKVAK